MYPWLYLRDDLRGLFGSSWRTYVELCEVKWHIQVEIEIIVSYTVNTQSVRTMLYLMQCIVKSKYIEFPIIW